MGMTRQEHIRKTWGSHQPLLKAAVEVLKPHKAIECGCGDFSTPILSKVPVLHTIEHDPKWGRDVARRFPDHEWTIHPVNAKNPTRIRDLPRGEYQRIVDFYEQLAAPMRGYDLLFVDTFTSCRVPAIRALGTRARYIIIHDMEPPGPEVYEWARLNKFLEGCSLYFHRPEGKVAGAYQIPWTVLACWKALEEDVLDRLNEVVSSESEALWGRAYPLEMCKEIVCD